MYRKKYILPNNTPNPHSISKLVRLVVASNAVARTIDERQSKRDRPKHVIPLQRDPEPVSEPKSENNFEIDPITPQLPSVQDFEPQLESNDVPFIVPEIPSCDGSEMMMMEGYVNDVPLDDFVVNIEDSYEMTPSTTMPVASRLRFEPSKPRKSKEHIPSRSAVMDAVPRAKVSLVLPGDRFFPWLELAPLSNSALTTFVTEVEKVRDEMSSCFISKVIPAMYDFLSVPDYNTYIELPNQINDIIHAMIPLVHEDRCAQLIMDGYSWGETNHDVVRKRTVISPEISDDEFDSLYGMINFVICGIYAHGYGINFNEYTWNPEIKLIFPYTPEPLSSPVTLSSGQTIHYHPRLLAERDIEKHRLEEALVCDIVCTKYYRSCLDMLADNIKIDKKNPGAKSSMRMDMLHPKYELYAVSVRRVLKILSLMMIGNMYVKTSQKHVPGGVFSV